MKTAFLFPGQGAQYVGMGKDLYESQSSARKIFEEADQTLGFSLTRLCFEGPFDELTKTENCQPAILTVSIAVLEMLKDEVVELRPSHVAGLSLGEYSALVAAGVLDFKDAVYLVRKRGEFMQEAARKNPGRMSCLLGLDLEVVRKICAKTGCQVANLNCPEQVVISGKNSQIEAASTMAMEQGAKRAIPLDVSGAFHSSLMDEASQKLKSEINKVRFQAPVFPLVSNVDAKEQTDPGVIKANLIKQVNSTTYWEASMRYLLEAGVGRFFEIGPGVVLKGLMRKIERAAQVFAVGRLTDIQEVAGVK